MKEYLDFDLDKYGYNRWGIKAGFNEEKKDYYYGLYFNIKDLFAVKDATIKHLVTPNVYPENGGIAGTVYLDLNCNGHRNPGEPGVSKIEILVDGRKNTESDNYGNFYITRRPQQNSVVVSLNMDTLPAIYTPTQGIQKAYWKEGSFTRVNLGVSVLGAISGTVKAIHIPEDIKNIAGVRVLLMQEDRKTVVKDSITSSDGSFYIGEVKPGKYVISIDVATIPDIYELQEAFKEVNIAAGKEPVEIENFVIILKLKEKKAVVEQKQESKRINTFKDYIFKYAGICFMGIIVFFIILSLIEKITKNKTK